LIKNHAIYGGLFKKILALLMVIVLTFNISFASNNQILDRAKKEYPNDIKMQQYVYRKQLSAYNYMNTVNDQEIKNMSTSEYLMIIQCKNIFII